MDTPIKKPKYDRATSEQLQCYVNFCRERPQLQAGKNCPKSPRQMQELWNELADGLNALRGPTRTAAKWKETLGVWKSQLRTRARRIKMSQRITGGGPCAKPMTDFEELALSTFGLAAVEGATSTGSFGLSPPQQGIPLERALDSPGGSLASSEGSFIIPVSSAPSPAVSVQAPVGLSPSPALSVQSPRGSSSSLDAREELLSENQSDTESDDAMPRVRSSRVERQNMFKALMNSIKRREEREKRREEDDKRHILMRDQQQRETVQALQCLTSCVSALVEEIKKNK